MAWAKKVPSAAGRANPVAQIRNEVRPRLRHDRHRRRADQRLGLMGQVVAPLLRWADRPVLVAR